ncbi:MAG: CoA transferase subunit A [Deltaproteobacteria bacterium]|nr:CoA transferase subunit A [Deltaproteobacteria bacterium]
MKNKIVELDEAIEKINDGVVMMVGGFLSVGTPLRIIDAIIKKGVKDITIISNDTGTPGRGNSRLIAARLVKKVITSHIGTNPETGKQMMEGTLEVELVPQGSLAEKIRAAGAGLGGVLTPTGVGTEAANGKQTIILNNREYLIEMPIKADVAILRGSVVDTFGNIFYNKTTQNFNTVMATAADTVIVEAEKIVERGELDANLVMTPGIFVDYIVRSNPNE